MKSDQLQYRSKERSKNENVFPQIAAATECETWPIADLENSDRIIDAIENAKDVLTVCFHQLEDSPTTRLMLREAADHGWKVGLANLEKLDFHLDVPERMIVLHDNGLDPAALARSQHFRNGLLVSMIRALRDVWHEKRHGGFDEEYDVESILLLERVRAADCDVIAVLAGWELRGEGHGDLWRHLIGSGEGDIALVFSGYLERDPSALFSLRAMHAAFRQWFQDEARVNACDHETLEYMDSVLKYAEGEQAFGKKRVGKICVELLSCLPDKTAYLRGQGHEILQGPDYAGLADPINQSHFLQLERDARAIRVQGVPFRDAGLAAKIFPHGKMTEEN